MLYLAAQASMPFLTAFLGLQEATKVFMGASGAMSNGTILARAGSASVAMVADAMQRPVIICCETLKFVDRVQLDSITYNELGDPNALADVANRPDLSALDGWQEQNQLGGHQFLSRVTVCFSTLLQLKCRDWMVAVLHLQAA